MKKRALQLFQILSIGLLASMLVFSQVKTDPKMIFIRASVTDQKGVVVENLKKEQFTITDEGIEQEISYFSDKDEAASVIILLDLSESISEQVFQANLKYAAKFIDASNPTNEYSIVGFGPNVAQLTDWKDGGSKTIGVLNKLTEMRLEGNTRFYDAISFAFEKFRTGANSKKILLIFSDGADNVSDDSWRKIRKELKQNDVTVHSISVLEPLEDSSARFIDPLVKLQTLAEISGGKVFFPITEEKKEMAITRIVAAVKKQYVIGYIPKEQRKKKDWHEVKVKAFTVDDKGGKRSLVVRAREGYYTGTK